jgi:hypothetical protein
VRSVRDLTLFPGARAPLFVLFLLLFVFSAAAVHAGTIPCRFCVGEPEGPDGRGLDDKEEKKMSKIITLATLHHRTISELRALHRKAQQDLAASAAGSPERVAALASLENISRALRAKLALGGPRF